MKMEVINGCVHGYLEFKPGVHNLSDASYYPTKPLYNFEWDVWTDRVLDSVIVCMWGSVISMMQFRKYILLNYPDVLIDD